MIDAASSKQISRPNTLHQSIRAFYAALAGEFAMFSVGVSLLFFHKYDHFSYTRSVILYVLMMLSAILFDMVGGGFADAYGRKRSYMAGIFLYVTAFGIPVIFVHQFYVLAVLAVVGGLGQGLKSNALAAIMADLLQSNQRQFRHVNARGNMVLFTAKTIAAAAGGVLYEIYQPLPFIAEAGALGFAAIVALRIHYPEKPTASNNPTVFAANALRHASAAIHYLHTRARGLLQAAVVASISAYFAGDLLFSYYQPFFARHGFSAMALGMIFAVVSACSALSSWAVTYLHHRGMRLGVLVMSAIGVAINGAGFWSGLTTVALCTLLIQALASGLTVPTLQLMAAEQTPSHLRASVLSATTTLTACGMLLGFLLSGWIADHGSNRVVGLIAILACISALILAICRVHGSSREEFGKSKISMLQ